MKYAVSLGKRSSLPMSVTLMCPTVWHQCAQQCDISVSIRATLNTEDSENWEKSSPQHHLSGKSAVKCATLSHASEHCHIFRNETCFKNFKMFMMFLDPTQKPTGWIRRMYIILDSMQFSIFAHVRSLNFQRNYWVHPCLHSISSANEIRYSDIQ